MKLIDYWEQTEYFKKNGLKSRIWHWWSICRYQLYVKLKGNMTEGIVGSNRLFFGQVSKGFPVFSDTTMKHLLKIWFGQVFLRKPTLKQRLAELALRQSSKISYKCGDKDCICNFEK